MYNVYNDFAISHGHGWGDWRQTNTVTLMTGHTDRLDMIGTKHKQTRNQELKMSHSKGLDDNILGSSIYMILKFQRN